MVGIRKWSTCTVPMLPSSSEILVSVVTRCLRKFELASPSQEVGAERTAVLSAFSLSTLEEQLEPQFAVGLGSPVPLVAKDTDEGNSSFVDSTASIKISRPLSGDLNVHCENSWVASFMSTVACFWGLLLFWFSTLHQSQIQFPVSRPSFDMEQYLRRDKQDTLWIQIQSPLGQSKTIQEQPK